VKIGSVQLEIKDEESKQQRIERVKQILGEMENYDLIILPEIWTTGYFAFDSYIQEAEELDGPFVRDFSQIARSKNVHLFAGSFIEKSGDNYFNTSIMFNPDGEVIGSYRKIHLFRYGSREGQLLTPGNDITVIHTPFGKIGLSTCYDLRFPELYRKQVDLGAEILLVTSAWPHQRLEHWNIFNVARALENQCYLISCNCVGKNQGVLLGGHSQVIDPWGRVITQADEKETILSAEISLPDIKVIREDFPQLKHRVLQ
jgi:predicted amidohydrolase